MASTSDVVELLFRGIDEVSDVAASVGGSVGELSDKVTAMADPFADAADKALLLEAAIVGLSAALVGKGISAASEFQSSFQFTTTLFEASSASIGTFRQDILDYASSSTQSIDSINKSLQAAIGGGIEYADSLGLLGEAERLAVAQSGQMESATRLLSSTLKAYGLDIDQASKLSDQFSVTIRDGNVSIDELAAGLSNVLPIAAASGVGFDQIGAALAVLTASSFQTGPAITGVKQIIEGIIKPTQQAAEFADSLGVSFNAQSLQAKGLNGVLIDVFNATGGNVDQMAQLFTTSEGLGAALALGGNGAAQFAAELAAMKDATGATQAAFEKMAGTIELGSQRIKNALEIAFINLGTPLLDEFGDIQSGIAKIFTDIAESLKSGGALTPVVAALEGFGDQIAAVVDSIATNLPDALNRLDFSGLIDSFGELGKEIASLFDALSGGADITTVEGLATALQKIVDLGTSLTTAVTGIISAFEPMAEAAGAAAQNFAELDQESQLDFGTLLGSAKIVVDTLEYLGIALLAVGQASLDMKVVMDAVFGGVEVLVNAFQVAFDGLAAAVTAPFALIAKGMVEMSELFGTSNSEMAQDAQDILRYFDAIGENATRNANELQAGWNKATGQATTETAALGVQLDTARARFGQLKPAIDESNKALTTQVTGFEDSISAVRRYEESIGVVVTVNDKIAVSTDTANKSIDALASNVGISKYTTSIEGAVAANDLLVVSYERIEGKTVKATGAFKSVSDSAADQAKKVEEATKKSQEYQLKMEEIASNERIKKIEAVVTLNVAQIEAQTRQVEAAFESINNTVSGSQDLIGSLFGDLSDADTFTKLEIQDQIDAENKRLDEQLDLQKQLVEAQIDNINAQTAALQRDMPMIQIDGTGLEPELEAFMWKILEKIRIRANATYANYLLGVT